MINVTPIKVFYFCVPADEVHRQRLEINLRALARHGVIDSWANNITIDSSDIVDVLGTADIVLFLISQDFLADDHDYRADFRYILEQQGSRRVYAIPILLRPVDIEGSPFSYIMPLPSNSKPITSWRDEDEAWVDISRGIRKIASDLRAIQGYEIANPSLAPAPIDPFTVAAAAASIAQVLLMVADMWSRGTKKRDGNKQNEVKEVRVLTNSGQWINFHPEAKEGEEWNEVKKVRALMSDNHWIELHTEHELKNFISIFTDPSAPLKLLLLQFHLENGQRIQLASSNDPIAFNKQLNDIINMLKW